MCSVRLSFETLHGPSGMPFADATKVAKPASTRLVAIWHGWSNFHYSSSSHTTLSALLQKHHQASFNHSNPTVTPKNNHSYPYCTYETNPIVEPSVAPKQRSHSKSNRQGLGYPIKLHNQYECLGSLFTLLLIINLIHFASLLGVGYDNKLTRRNIHFGCKKKCSTGMLMKRALD